MSNISVNTHELQQLLENTPATHNIMLVGKHGIGKSEILTEFFKEKEMSVVALFLGQMADPGDLIGLPCKNEQSGKTEFMPPYWFPTDGKPIVLFLEELGENLGFSYTMLADKHYVVCRGCVLKQLLQFVCVY